MSATTNFYKYLVNPVMLRLLRSPLHGITSRNIAILHDEHARAIERVDIALNQRPDAAGTGGIQCRL